MGSLFEFYPGRLFLCLKIMEKPLLKIHLEIANFGQHLSH